MPGNPPKSEIPLIAQQNKLEPDYFRFLLAVRPRLQALAIFLAFLTIPLTYAVLHIPKIIVDDGIQGQGFPKTLMGLEFNQISFLVTLCLAFFLLNTSTGLLKLKLNTLAGYISEIGLRDLRMAVLRNLHKHKNDDIPASQKTQIVIPEMEAFGGFIGDFLTIPIIQLSTMGTIVFFMFEQNPFLGIAALAVIPAQAFLVPILQRRVIRAKKMRIKLVRKFANSIERHDGTDFDSQENIASNPGVSYKIFTNNILKNRMYLYRSKYFLKFINNMLAKATPFLFYLIGGILVIEGDITLGTLTAALVAYQQLDEPWRVLVQYYQQLSTTRMQYDQILEKVA